MDIQRAAELLAAHSTKEFGNALKDRALLNNAKNNLETSINH